MDPLVYEKTLHRSREFTGALGAVSFVVMEAFRRAGTDPDRAAGVRELLEESLPRLSDADANTLCDVLFARFHEELRRSRRGEWYGDPPRGDSSP